MKKNILLLLLMTVFVFKAFSQWTDDPVVNTIVNNLSGDQAVPHIAYDTAGNFYVGFYSNESGNYDIRLQYFSFDGVAQWDSDGLLVSDNAQNSWITDWDLTTDKNGNCVLAFNDVRDGNANVFAYSISPFGSFLWGNNGIRLTDDPEDEYVPSITVTSSNNVIVAWMRPTATQAEIVMQRITPAGVLSWGDAGITYQSGPKSYAGPRVLGVENDHYLMAFYKQTGNFPYLIREIYVQKFDSTGSAVWSSDVLASNSNGISSFNNFTIASDNGNGIVIAWTDDRNSDNNIDGEVQRVLSDGSILWPANGSEVSTQNNFSHQAVRILGVNDNDEVVVGWSKKNSNQSQTAISGQKFSSTGTRLWTSGGIDFVAMSAGVDGCDGGVLYNGSNAIIVYEEYVAGSSTKSHVKALGIDSTGAFTWTPDTTLMASRATEKLHLDLSAIYNQQLIAVWEEGTPTDIYMQNIYNDGTMGDTPPLHAQFEAGDTVICSGSSVNFTDLSVGNPTSWLWTFEGGTPSSSTDQNPTVTYSSTGSYDVELTVSTDYGSNTLSKTDYITVLVTPGQVDQPSGDTLVCTGVYYEYTTSSVDFAQDYEWELSPAAAGTLTVEDTTAGFQVSDTYTGSFSIRARATNICGDGNWSDYLNGNVYLNPTDFDLDGGGGYCSGGEGVEITLSGSETGVDYELYLDGVATGNIVSGTGSEITFGYVTDEGFYTAVGSNGHCDLQMNNQVQVEILYPPLEPGTPTGPQVVCNNETSQYESDGSDDADSYVWVLTPDDAGTLTANGLEATIAWNTDFTGTASVSLYGVNDCGDGNPSEALEVQVNAVPVPVITGENEVCDNTSENYSVADFEGSTYTWDLTGGTITNGQGTNMITVEWGESGTGTINVEVVTPDSCTGTSGDFPVVIDDCTGVPEIENGTAFRVYPNPAENRLTIEFIRKNNDSGKILIYNHFGQVVISKKVEHEKQVQINLSGIASGLYIVKFVSKGQVSGRAHFIKR